MRVLAIDPGYDRLGIAVLEGNPSRPTLLWSACVEPPRGEKEMRLRVVHEAIANTAKEYTPDYFALETLFFSTNKKTALGVAEARGAALSAASAAGLPVREISPGTVKLAVTGNGRADKKAIALMVPKLVSLPAKARRLDDELDAIAVGIAALSLGNPQR
jgi:crossover junction endodeoxyribonuclease RuvC